MEITKLEGNQYKYTFEQKIVKPGVEEESDKYLYDKGRTIGFRKDRKLYKFVGLRDGYSKQLELTLKSVIIDDSEKIAANRVNFNEISLSGDTVSHIINGFEFSNRVNSSNYKNLIKVTEQFEDLSILYEVHISDGMIFDNFSRPFGDKIVFSSNIDDHFVVIDEYSKKELFKFDVPVAYTNDNKKLKIIAHELYKEGDSYFYKKTIRGNNTDIDKYPLYVDASIIWGYTTFRGEYSDSVYGYPTIESAWGEAISPTASTDYEFTEEWLYNKLVGTPGDYDAECSRPTIGFYTGDGQLPVGVDIISAIIVLNSYNNATYTDPTFKTMVTRCAAGFSWNDYGEPPYKLLNNPTEEYFLPSTGGTAISVPAEDINLIGYSFFMIRSYDHDYLGTPPSVGYNKGHRFTGASLEVIYAVEPSVTGQTIYEYPVQELGFGAGHGDGTTIPLAKQDEYPVWYGNSENGTYGTAIGYSHGTTNHSLYRTFLKFNTPSFLNDMEYVVMSAKLKTKSTSNNSTEISVVKGGQGDTNPLQGGIFNDWVKLHAPTRYGQTNGIPSNENFDIKLSNSVINNQSSSTKIVLISTRFDYGGDDSEPIGYNEYTGLNFSETYLEVTVDPYLIDGITYVKAPKGKMVELYANKNTTDGEIVWSSDSGFTNIFGTGQLIDVDTSSFNSGDYIYACIMEPIGYKVSGNILEVELDLYGEGYDFNSLPGRNYNVHSVDLDAVYFKFHKCISGVCYAYVRDLEDVYEQNNEVSDGEGLGAYNLYNEFDIIDEFFSNSHEVEVVGNLDEIDLNISYKKINDILIHEGTRILLHSTVPSENDGVYVADFNLMLHKTDELEDEEKAFRYKAHVNAGEYLDYEFHTIYFSTSDNGGEFSFDYLDSNIYGELVLDLVVYGVTLFDSNVL